MTFLQKLQNLFIEPSPKIESPDQRRQASLLSAFLLGTILVAILVEIATIAFIEWENYTGYRQTFMTVLALGIIYLVSRTQHVYRAAVLSVVVASIAIFIAGWAVPDGVLGGLFDFMILPLWLASLYLKLRELVLLVIADLLGMLVFPFFTPEVTFNDILVGPFSFLFATSILLMVITSHRNSLEQDRRVELADQEVRSRREAARANALLRVAERLNAQLDQDALLNAICEEVTRALDTPVSLVTLYDPKHNSYMAAAVAGIPAERLAEIPPLPRTGVEQAIQKYGMLRTPPGHPDRQRFPFMESLEGFDLHTLAFAVMDYDRQVIGYLTAITTSEYRVFTEDELLLLHGVAGQAALAIVNTRLFKDAHRRLENLQALRAIDLAILTNHDLRDTLEVLLEQITGQLQVDAAVFLLMEAGGQELQYGASRGFNTPSLQFTRLRLGEGIAGRAALQREIFHIGDLKTDPQTLMYAPSLAQEGFVSYFAAPLIAQEGVTGVLELFHRSALEPDAEWMRFLEALAGQAAIAIENTTLIEDLQNVNLELSMAYDSTIEGWSHALDLRDKETEGHTQRVTELTLELARTFGYGEYALVHIRRGALLHDIGKMGVPDRILLKEGRLTNEEWEIMQKHPDYAHEMLQPIAYLRPALEIPYCHHEKWDGSGYPRGLKGEEIPLTARIFAVVDVWDALISDRPYRAAWPEAKVLDHIRQGTGSHFDPRVVDAFVDLIGRRSKSPGS
jgi:HD-GYP domain-containing protein (c-di-GMP phosphodiesterase class II)